MISRNFIFIMYLPIQLKFTSNSHLFIYRYTKLFNITTIQYKNYYCVLINTDFKQKKWTKLFILLNIW